MKKVAFIRLGTLFDVVTGVLLLFLSVTAYGQRTIKINAKDIVPMSLSDIATAVHHIDLEPAGFEYISEVTYADPYLFINVHSIVNEQKTPTRMLQYNLTGKLVREILNEETEGSKIGKVMCDISQKRLFVAFGRETKCYDFSGKLLNAIPITPSPKFYYNQQFWMTSVEPKNDIIHYSLSNYDLNTFVKTNITADIKDKVIRGDGGAFTACHPSFSVYDNSVHVAFSGLDNTIYRVQGQKLSPIIQYSTVPPPSMPIDKYGYKFQGFIGKYLFIHYMLKMQSYLYVEDLSNKRTYNVKFIMYPTAKEGITDDLFGTGVCDVRPLNVENHFYFVKKTNEATVKNGNPDENYTIYIAKTK
ncbi:MAG: hypothetical protein LBN11_02205 [Tannerella sp.]|jgi:hypothetical protein|nr:hypothetical protein [Tannerella sp.]